MAAAAHFHKPGWSFQNHNGSTRDPSPHLSLIYSETQPSSAVLRQLPNPTQSGCNSGLEHPRHPQGPLAPGTFSSCPGPLWAQGRDTQTEVTPLLRYHAGYLHIVGSRWQTKYQKQANLQDPWKHGWGWDIPAQPHRTTKPWCIPDTFRSNTEASLWGPGYALAYKPLPPSSHLILRSSQMIFKASLASLLCQCSNYPIIRRMLVPSLLVSLCQ